jgi:hypothetical protein
MPAVPPAGIVARGHPVGRREALTNISHADGGLANGAGELRIESVSSKNNFTRITSTAELTMITQTV